MNWLLIAILVYADGSMEVIQDFHPSEQQCEHQIQLIKASAQEVTEHLFEIKVQSAICKEVPNAGTN